MKFGAVRRRLGLTLLTLCLLWLGVLICAPSASAGDGIFIQAKDRIDGVFAPDNSIVYISAGDRVLRYDLNTRSFLTPFVLGGHLMGMDLSPDGKTLAVADGSYNFSEAQLWLHLVQVDTGAHEQITFAGASSEGGTYSVGYGKDGRLLVSSVYVASGGSIPLRRYDPAAGTTTALTSVGEVTMLSASADRSVIAYARTADSQVPLGRYIVATGAIVESGQTSWSVYVVAANRNATQFIIPTYGGAFVYDAAGQQIATLASRAAGRRSSAQPTTRRRTCSIRSGWGPGSYGCWRAPTSSRWTASTWATPLGRTAIGRTSTGA